jgi:hypothetical protein
MANLSQADINNILDGLTDRILNGAEFPQFRGPQGPQGQPPATAGLQIVDTRWRIEEFGLFQPDLQVDERNPPGDVITVGKDSVYRNVDAFCERIKDAIATKGAVTVRDNLHLCLRGAASRWWTFEVSDIDKEAVRADNTQNLQQWNARLTARFRPRMAQAVRENSELSFKISDIRAGKRVLAYFQSKILKARAAGFESVQGQLIQVYSGLDVALRRDLFEPTPETSLSQFRDLLMEKEELWVEAYKSRPSPFMPQRSFPNLQSRIAYYNRPQNTPPQSLAQQQYQNQRPSYGNQNANTRSSVPCPFHAAVGQTYYHPASFCRLRQGPLPTTPPSQGAFNRQTPASPQGRFPQDNQPTPRVEIINFQEQPAMQAARGISWDEVCQEARDRDAREHGDYNAHGVDNYHQDFEAEMDQDYHYDEDQISGFFVHETASTYLRSTCATCNVQYPSRNKLFKHLDEMNHRAVIVTEMSNSADVFTVEAQIQPSVQPRIIVSNAPPVAGSGLAFRTSNYLEIGVKTHPSGNDHFVCLDTGCGMTCFDKKFFLEQYSEAAIQTIPPIEIRGLGNKVHLSDEYAVVDLYFPGFQGREPGLGKITREVHLVGELPCKALIGNDITDVEGFNIDIQSRICTIKSVENLACPLLITPRGKPVEHRTVRTKNDVILKRHSKTLVPVVSRKLPDDRDFHFKPYYTPHTAHLAMHGAFCETALNTTSMFVVYYNNSESGIFLPANTNIGELSDWDSNVKILREDPRVVDCLFTATKVTPTLSQALALDITAMQAAQVYSRAGDTYSPDPSAFMIIASDDSDILDIYSLFPPLDECGDAPSRFGPQAVHINTTDDITQEQIDRLRAVVAEFPELWEDRIGRVNQPEEEWMKIPLKPGAVLDSKGRYRVSKRDEAAIDEAFDKARADGRLSAAEGAVPVGWPVFVVWKNGKARPVVDLRGLNAQTVMDAYPLPRPEDVTGLAKDKYYVALVDLQKSFGQLWLAYLDRWKTTTLTHRGQEVWNIVPTGATGSPSHMQRFMDKLLKKHEEYAKSYVDDVFIFSDDFESHIQHLRAVFSEFSRTGLTLSPDKCYVGYHSMKVLGHVVDRFGLSTLEDKVSAIASMRFPEYLHQLELFIGLSGYYRHFIARYAAIIDPLQSLKTKMLKGADRKNKRERQAFTKSKRLDNPTEAETISFQAVKDALCSKTVLIHHDGNLPLLIDVDSSIDGYAAAVHQIPQAAMEKENLTIDAIISGKYNRKLERPITYISKQLNKHEIHYWPTELEIAGIVWTIQKLRHLIEGIGPTMLYTDHKPAADILSSTTLKTSSSVRMNLRLIRASQFVSQYPTVKIVYRPGKDNVNADALSRLVKLRTVHDPTPDGDDEGVYGFLTTVVGVSMSTLRLLEEGYANDPHFRLIYDNVRERMKIRDEMLVESNNDDNNAIVSYKEFSRIDKLAPEEIEYNGFQGRLLRGHILLYIRDPITGHPRLCIPSNCHKTFFEAAHDKNVHAGYHKAYNLLRQHYYIKNLSRALRSYVQSCPSCQQNNTLRHMPHGQLQPITSPDYPFQMVTLDLIVKLPESSYGDVRYDTCHVRRSRDR